MYNIEILKYEKVEKGGGGGSGGPSGGHVVVFFIDVYRRRPAQWCPVHQQDDARDEEREDGGERSSVVGVGIARVRIYPHKCTCKKWTIRRRYTDFDGLHKHLKSQVLGPRLSALHPLLQKAFVQAVQ
jgi:hypothetical protein